MKHSYDCINLDKVIKITELMIGFGDDETSNLQSLLIKMTKIFNCDKIAYIQYDCETNTDDIITPSDTFKEILLKNNLHKIILDYTSDKKEVTIIDKNNQIYDKYVIDYFAAIVPVVLNGEHIGCLILSYSENTIGSHLFQSSDLSHFKLAANIISIQEKSYRFKNILQQTNKYRHVLNKLSENLLSSSNDEMDAYIQKCIQKTCEIWNIDRGYLFLVDFAEKKLLKTNEWCNTNNVKSLLKSEKVVDMNSFPWANIIQYFINSPTTPIHIPNMLNQSEFLGKNINIDEKIVDEVKHQLDVLVKNKKLKSCLLIPVSDTYNNNTYTLAILGFSQVLNFKNFTNQLIDMLTTLSCYLSEAVKRRREFQNRNRIDKFIVQNMIKWRSENNKNIKIFEDLQSKMQSIFDDSRRKSEIVNV